MREVKFGELKIGEIATQKIAESLAKNWISEGANTKEFERLFAEKFGYKYAIATSSGTTALQAALMALYEFGADYGDEIIVPACTFVATANAVLAAGFSPRFVDIELETLNMNPSLLEDAFSDHTVGVIPVHLMGKPAKMNEIRTIANQHGCAIIEDCCEAHGAKYHGKYVGTIGDAGCFSFFVAHVVVAGEGGMVVTDDPQFATLVQSVKSHGRPPGSQYFDFQRFGLNLKTNDLCAAVGIEGMTQFDETFNRRKENLYKMLIGTSDLDDHAYFIHEEPHEIISPHAFPILLKEDGHRDNLYRYLESCGIQVKTLFGSLPTQHNAFSFLSYKLGDFPNAEYIGRNGLHIGIHKYLTSDDIVYITETLQKYFELRTT